jgi:hypothetical protein
MTSADELDIRRSTARIAWNPESIRRYEFRPNRVIQKQSAGTCPVWRLAHVDRFRVFGR